MNTKLQDRPTTDSLPETHFSRPQPFPEATKNVAASAPKRRWMAAVAGVLAVAAIVAVTLTADSSPAEPPASVTNDAPAFDSPGGNSMRIHPRAEAVDTTGPSPLFTSDFESPSGNSMRIHPRSERADTTGPSPLFASEFDSPSGNSMRIPPRTTN